jgi:hypothetical protein
MSGMSVGSPYVPLDLHRRRNEIDEGAEVGRPADAVELLTSRELDLDGERVDALATLQELVDRVVDALMPRDVEVVGRDQIRDLEDRVAVDEQAAEHVLLRRFVERCLALWPRIERHADKSRTGVLRSNERPSAIHACAEEAPRHGGRYCRARSRDTRFVHELIHELVHTEEGATEPCACS